MNHQNNSFSKLNEAIDGDVLYDEVSRMLYATDASLYQELPLAVARPKSKADCQIVIKFANKNDIPIIPRAAGTSLAGQVVGNALIVDVSRYMTHVLSIDKISKTARIEPGVIPQALNQQLATVGLKFAPDPSTDDRCTIAGMIGNNAWGAHAPKYGTTRDHIVAMEVILATGETVQIKSMDQQLLADVKTTDSHEAKIYNTVISEIRSKKTDIIEHYPDPKSVPCNTGYALHIMALQQPFTANGGQFSLVPLICGSEGTLVFITEITVNLVPITPCRAMICAHFNSIQDALVAVAACKYYQPDAIELLDHTLLSLTKTNLAQQPNRCWIKGDPGAVLLIEFLGDNIGLIKDKVSQLSTLLQQSKQSTYCPLLMNDDCDKAWQIRRAALGMLMGVPGKAKAITFIEDSAVPAESLADFVSHVEQLMSQPQTKCVYYGSVSMGLIHLRPILDLRLSNDRKVFLRIEEQVATLCKTFQGTLTAKHGDGRVRGPFIKQQLGSEIYRILVRIKNSFDPQNVFNPGKIVFCKKVDDDLRIDYGPQEPGLRKGYFNWGPEGSLYSELEKCNGAGVCRKTGGEGTMCPSYRVLQEEKHTTRGRANVFRQIIGNRGIDQGMCAHELKNVLGFCLSCKGCKAECPANIDMARLKSEFLQHYMDVHGKTKQDRFIEYFELISSICSRLPTISNKFSQKAAVKRFLGIHPKRPIPPIASQSFLNWFNQHRPAPDNPSGKLILLVEAFMNYFEPNIGIAATEYFTRSGITVVPSPCLPSIRAAISQGLLRTAKARIHHWIKQLTPYLKSDIDIVGLEPSEILVIRDDAMDLIDEKHCKAGLTAIANKAKLFEEYLCNHKDSIAPFTTPQTNTMQHLLLHGHCHQKALGSLQATMDALSLLPGVRLTMIPSGCCGMAGNFGYEKENYQLSVDIANLVLLPTIRSAPADTIIVAPGLSCRQQILHGSGIRALHPAEVLRNGFKKTT